MSDDIVVVPEVVCCPSSHSEPSDHSDQSHQSNAPSGNGEYTRSDILRDPEKFFHIKSWHTRKDLLKSKTVCNKIHQYLLDNIKDKQRPKDAIEPVYFLETILLTSHTYLRILYNLGSLYLNKGLQPVIGKGTNTRSVFPNKPAVMNHIFRDKEGHIPNTPQNQAEILRICNDGKCYLGTDKHGNMWFAETRKDGTQLWASTRNGEIRNGGMNNFANKYNPETGLSAKSKPSQKSRHMGFFHERAETINRRTSVSRDVLFSRILFKPNGFR